MGEWIVLTLVKKKPTLEQYLMGPMHRSPVKNGMYHIRCEFYSKLERIPLFKNATQ